MAGVSLALIHVWTLELEKAAKELAFRIGLPLESTFLVRPVETELSSEEQNRLSTDQKSKYASITDPVRKMEWSESRRCNWLLESSSFQTLSHSKADAQSGSDHLVLAWGISDPSAALHGIGIDVELRSRLISDATAERFATPAERKLGLPWVELWTIKEALFKANPSNQGSVVTDYKILNRDPGGVGQGQGPQGEKYLFRTFDLGPWQITLALQTAQNHSQAS